MSASMKISEPLLRLQNDHRAVLKESSLLLVTLKEMHRNSGASARLARKSMLCLSRLKRSLAIHQTREEHLLLPVIEKFLDSEVSASIVSEHQQISKSLEDLTDLVNSLGTRRVRASADAVAKSVAAFDSLTRAHFSREENVLFWFASVRLSESDLREIDRGLNKLEALQ